MKRKLLEHIAYFTTITAVRLSRVTGIFIEEIEPLLDELESEGKILAGYDYCTENGCNQLHYYVSPTYEVGKLELVDKWVL